MHPRRKPVSARKGGGEKERHDDAKKAKAAAAELDAGTPKPRAPRVEGKDEKVVILFHTHSW